MLSSLDKLNFYRYFHYVLGKVSRDAHRMTKIITREKEKIGEIYIFKKNMYTPCNARFIFSKASLAVLVL